MDLLENPLAIPRRCPPLHIAARHPHQAYKIRAALADSDVAEKHLNTVGKRGETLLHAAVHSNNPETVELVLRAQPGLLALQDVHGNTPLHSAIKLKPNGAGQQRQLKILQMLLKENRVDTKKFFGFTWVKKSTGTEKRTWRLNLLRFAIVFNSAEPVLDLLEAHGAVLGHDHQLTDFPTSLAELKNSNGSQFAKRIPFFEGLVNHEGKLNTTRGQHLVLRRYPAAVHFGTPHMREIIINSRQSAEQVHIVERLTGSLLPAPKLDNALEYQLRSTFLLDVLVVEGGIEETFNVGRMLRSVRSGNIHPWQQLWDALLVDFRMSSHQMSKSWDYRDWHRFSRCELIEREESQAPVLFEAADLV